MKDMFYNYDHNIIKKEWPEPNWNKRPNKLDGYSGQYIVKDWKDNEIGIRVHQGTPIKLHFDFSGHIDKDTDIETFLNYEYNTITLQIVDIFHNVLIEKTYKDAVKDNSLDVEITEEEDLKNLKKDTYYIRLYINTQLLEKYTLYDERDGFLSII